MNRNQVTAAATAAQSNGHRLSGVEGGCVACQHPIHKHLDKHGAWVGCPEADPDTTFILVPVRTVRSTAQVARPATTTAAPVRTVRSQVGVARPRFRYVCVDRRARPVLSEVRAKVYDTLRKHPEGLLSRDLIKRTKLVHGSIQQTLNWLRTKKYVRAEAVKS